MAPPGQTESLKEGASWLARLLSVWFGGESNATLRHTVFLAALALLCGATAFIGVPWFYKYTHDLFVFLDGGWRTLHGQRPHIDFFSGVGPVTYLVNALGLKVAGFRPEAVGAGSALVGLVVGLWAYGVALRRIGSGAGAALASLFMVLLAVAPYALGERPIDTGVAVLYNRYGAAILGIVLIETYRPLRDSAAGFGGGFSSGAACGLLWFIKVSYLVGALPFLALALFYAGRGRRRYLSGLTAGFLLAALPLLWYMHFDLAAMFRDLFHIAMARRGENSHMWAIVASYFDWLGLALLVGFLYATRGSAPGGWKERREAIYAVAVSLVGVLVLFTNHQASGMPLNSLLAILIAATLSRPAKALRSIRESELLAATVLLALMIALPSIASDSISVAFSLTRRVFYPHPDEGRAIHASRLAGIWLFADFPRDDTMEYARDIEDGISMIERLSRPDESVYSLDFTSPFSFALARPPFHGGAWALHYRMGIDERYHPDADFLFGDVRILMKPKYPTANLDGILEIYGDYLDSHFHQVAESSRWRMYRRN